MAELEIPRIAILASGDRETGGGGSTANRVARDALEGKVELDIGVVICNNPPGSVGVYDLFDAINTDFGLQGDQKIVVENISGKTHPKGPQERGQTLGESEAICRLLEQRGIGFAMMLGYMKQLNGEFVETWGWKPEYGIADTLHNGIYHPAARIGNNHPAILPFTADTHGPGSHARSLELYQQGRIRYTNMTRHLAMAGIDTGPVFFEEPVPIFAHDGAESLGERVREAEKDLTALVIEKHLILRGEQLRGNS